MKKNIIILIVSILFISLIASSLIAYAGSFKQEISLEEKTTQELQYIDNRLITILGQFNGLYMEDYDLQLSAKKTSPEEQQSEETNTQTESNSQTGSSSNTSQSNNESTSNTSNNMNTTNNNQVNQTQNRILLYQGKYPTNWEFIQLEAEKLYQTWNTVSLDLNTLNVDSNLILSFSDYMNNATQNIKNRDKAKSMIAFTNMYQLLPQYIKSYSNGNQKTIISEIKSNVVVSYTNITTGNWDKATQNLVQAEQLFSNMLNTININYENQTTMNQTYILINELKRAVDIKDREIFYIQFQNLISKMQLLN